MAGILVAMVIIVARKGGDCRWGLLPVGVQGQIQIPAMHLAQMVWFVHGMERMAGILVARVIIVALRTANFRVGASFPGMKHGGLA